MDGQAGGAAGVGKAQSGTGSAADGFGEGDDEADDDAGVVDVDEREGEVDKERERQELRYDISSFPSLSGVKRLISVLGVDVDVLVLRGEVDGVMRNSVLTGL